MTHYKNEDINVIKRKNTYIRKRINQNKYFSRLKPLQNLTDTFTDLTDTFTEVYNINLFFKNLTQIQSTIIYFFSNTY